MTELHSTLNFNIWGLWLYKYRIKYITGNISRQIYIFFDKKQLISFIMLYNNVGELVIDTKLDTILRAARLSQCIRNFS